MPGANPRTGYPVRARSVGIAENQRVRIWPAKTESEPKFPAPSSGNATMPVSFERADDRACCDAYVGSWHSS
jgi:hypothetical protein